MLDVVISYISLRGYKASGGGGGGEGGSQRAAVKGRKARGDIG